MSSYNSERSEKERAREIGGRERILWSMLVDESERGGGGNAKTEEETKTKRGTAGQASTSRFINSR